MNQVIISAAIIFLIRLVGLTCATLRILMVVRGMKSLAWILGLIQAFTYVTALGLVLEDMGNWLKVLGYSMGFATGLVAGMVIENRLAIGYTNIRIISTNRGIEIAEGLRGAGYAVTEVSAQGRGGMVSILHCSVLRRSEAKLRTSIINLDPDAFITAENVYLVQRGFWN